MRANKSFLYLKWASHFWISIQNFIFSPEDIFLVMGGRVVGLGGGGPPDQPPPPVISTSLSGTRRS